jgi:hypothetical protein
MMSENGKAHKAWEKVLGADVKTEPAGVIPVWDGEDGWRLYRNFAVVSTDPADPVQVEKLRLNVIALVQNFPETMPELEKLGVRVRTLLNKTIKNEADIEAWAGSFFNVGPSKRFFSLKPPRAVRSRTEATGANGAGEGGSGSVRPRGRPRKDGLMPGSPEAKEADRVRKEEAASERAAKQAAKLATITELPKPEAPARRVLARVGSGVSP